MLVSKLMVTDLVKAAVAKNWTYVKRQADKILELNPDHPDALYAMALFNVGQSSDYLKAIELLQKVTLYQPEFGLGWYQLGYCYLNTGQYRLALENILTSIKYDFKQTASFYDAGYCLHQLGRDEEAITYYERALALTSNDYKCINGIGLSYLALGKTETAIEYIEKAISIKADSPEHHFNLGCALLSKGDFDQGWIEYDWRRKLPRHNKAFDEHPVWDGSSFSGCTLLITVEQGFGDMIFFSRYFKQLRLRAPVEGRIISLVPKEMLKLFKTSFVETGILDDVFAGEGQKVRFHTWTPIGSLPYRLGVRSNITSVGSYISVEAERVERWKSILNLDTAKANVGICWAGRRDDLFDWKRSVSLEQMISLFERKDKVRLISLCKEQRPKGGDPVDDYFDQVTDFSDTAAIIKNLDFVVTVDTAIAHLAGALGKRVLLLLPFVKDWRWGEPDAPVYQLPSWYPKMNYFRQSKPNDWTKPFIEIKKSIEHEIKYLPNYRNE